MCKNKNKVLILGSDFGTYDLALEAKKMGLYVIATDLMKTSPTKKIADESWYISTTDLNLLEKKIIEEKIDGILTGASEFNIENCRELCKRLNMPVYCKNDKAWNIARDKYEFKQLCKECGVPVAKDYNLTDDLNDDELNNIEYPVVVKPVDKSGNRGMSFCNNKEELIKGYKYARSISDNKNIIVEKQLIGPEYTGYYVLADGEVALSYYTSAHHQKGELSNIYSFENLTTHHLKQYLDEVDGGIKQVFRKAGCTDGICWIESMYDQNGHFYVLEMGYRFAGPVLYPMSDRISGFNTYKWMIECAMGIRHKKEQLPNKLPVYNKCAASYNLFTNREAIIDKIEGLDEIQNLKNVIIDFPKREGETVRYHANMGVVRILGNNCEELCETAQFINEKLFIKDHLGDNIFIKYDDFDSIKKEYEKGMAEFNIL